VIKRPPPAELLEFLAAFDPAITPLFIAVRERVLLTAPQANELIYDAYNAVSAAYSFSDHLKEGFCHVAAYARHVNLGFNRGAALDDPTGLLRGNGTSIRHVRMQTATDLEQPGLQALLRAAVAEGAGLCPQMPQAPASIIKPTRGAKRRP